MPVVGLCIAGVVGLVVFLGYLSIATGDAVRLQLQRVSGGATRELVGASDMEVALGTIRTTAQALLTDAWSIRASAPTAGTLSG